jgi:putative adhesin
MKGARILLRVVVCALVVLGSAGCELYAGAPVEGRFDRTLNVNGPVDLDIRTGSGGIRIDTGPTNSVHVVARIRINGWFDSDPEQRVRQIEANPPIQQDGNTIRIGQVGDNERYQRASIAYEVTVPEATSVHSAAGSGGQTIRHVRGPVHATAGSGGIRIDGTQGDVHVTAGSGGIRLTGIHGAVVARAGSGGIMLSVADNLPFELDASAGSGGIANHQPLAPIGAISKHRVRGTVRGGGPRVELSTGSGGILIE